MGGVAAASLSTIGTMSVRCGHPLAYSSVLSQFSARGLGSEGFAVSWGPKKCAWWGVVERKCSSLKWRWRQPSCSAESNAGGDAGARNVLRIPVLDKDENGNFVMQEFSDTKIFDSSGSSAASSKQSRAPSKKSAVREPKIVAGKPGSAGSSSAVKVNLPALDPRARRLATAKVSSRGAPLYSKAARRFYNEKFRAEPQRLSKVLAAAGVASRRACEEVIFDGRVAVNGIVCKVPQTPVDPLKDIIYVDGHSLPKKMAPKLYFALNKPKGYICSAGEEGTRPVLSLFHEYFTVWAQRNPGLAKPRMFTVGRLDVATSGLLLVTNDGDFAQKVSHPSSGLTKEYTVTVNEKVTRRQLQAIANGTLVQGIMCIPTEVELIDIESHDGRQRLRIVVSEGRNHEVRHLVENAGLQVLALKRTRIGSLRLSRKLGIGKFDQLTEAQVSNLLKKNSQSLV